jgi:hypothetical protein
MHHFIIILFFLMSICTATRLHVGRRGVGVRLPVWARDFLFSMTEINTRNLPGGKGRPALDAGNLTAIYEPIVYKTWEPRRLISLHVSTACYRDSFTFITSILSLGPTQTPIQWIPEAVSLGIKRYGREADHLPPPSAEIKNDGVIPPLPQTS